MIYAKSMPFMEEISHFRMWSQSYTDVKILRQVFYLARMQTIADTLCSIARTMLLKTPWVNGYDVYMNGAVK